jgi:hypothetical protein
VPCPRMFAHVCMGVLALAGVLRHPDVATADEDDLVSSIAKTLPPGWSVTVHSLQGRCFVEIMTARMETKPSRYGSSYPTIDQKRVGISIQVMPRYTPAMRVRIRSHNEPIRKQVKALGGHKYSDRQRELESQLIDEPMFYDRNYGFTVSYPPRVPTRPDDARALVNVLERVTSDWRCYNDDQPKAPDELRRRYYQ